VTPGAGRIYKKKGDPPQRSTSLKPAYPRPPAAPAAAHGPQLPPGQMPLDSEEGAGGTGAHGILSKGDLLIYVCPPSRAIFVINQKTWEVQDVWPTPGNRPHGITWVDASKTGFWNVDSNLNTFYRYDANNGAILEAVTVREEPHTVCHGAKLINNYMYFCDDVGWLCRIKWV
jgi:hypothetical protein